MLAAQSPEALALNLVVGTRLGDLRVRRALWEGGQKAIDASDDPLIRLVAANDAAALKLRTAWEQTVVAYEDLLGRIGVHPAPDRLPQPRSAAPATAESRDAAV